MPVLAKWCFATQNCRRTSMTLALRKLVHAIYRDLLSCKKMKIFIRFFYIYIFLIFAQNIDCGYTLEPPRRGGSNEYVQSMFWSKNKKKLVYPCIPQFYYIKEGYEGVYISRTCFLMLHS